jgi:hypothetical protein
MESFEEPEKLCVRPFIHERMKVESEEVILEAIDNFALAHRDVSG